MTTVGAEVEAALRVVFGRDVRIERREYLGGGSINLTERIRTTAGWFIVKSNASAPSGFFAAEAAGLEALRASGTTLAIPMVVAQSAGPSQWLVLEDLDTRPAAPAASGASFDERLGTGLALLHRASAPRFGFPSDNFCGLTPQPNPWTTGWIEFYGQSRLGHQLTLARQSGRIGAGDSTRLEHLIDHLDQWLVEPAEGPALIHGDLWSGNLHRDASGAPAIFDPAAYYAHREAELGMMTLFGGFGPRVFAAYHEAFPLEPGWRDRNALYQLYHLLNHLNLFGEGYLGQAMGIVSRYV